MSRILIVDDDVEVCEILKRVLRYAGYESETAVDAVSALRLAEASQPAAAIVDFVLPDRDGIALSEKLRAAVPGIGILMVSGIIDFEEQVGPIARAAGIDRFLQKPLRPPDVVACLGEMVPLN